MRRRPFRAPHHTVSNAGLIGGGSHPRPGEVSLAHNGVLFLDELPEFPRRVLENLRQPLEAGEVTIARAALTLTYPARFMLAAAMNPCPCGFRGDRARACRCTPREVDAYRSRISGPLLDRIDLHVEVPALAYDELAAAPPGEGTAAVRARVERARAVQRERLQGAAIYCNAQMGAREVARALPPRRRRRAPAGGGDARARALGARLRAGAQGRADDRGSGGRAEDRHHPRRRGDPVPGAAPSILAD